MKRETTVAEDFRELSARRGDFAVTTAGVLGLALVLRAFAAWFSLHQPGGWFQKQGLEMSFMARSLAEGHGLSSPFGVETGPTAMFGPVYPLIVSVFFRFFGVDSQASAVGIVALQVIVNLLAIAMMMYLARMLFDKRVALTAGLIWTLSPPLWFMPTIFWDTTITVFLMAALISAAFRVVRTPEWKAWLLFGALCGAAGLFNPALVPTLICLLVVMTLVCIGAVGRRVVGRAALAALVFAAVFSAWPIRNARVFHAFVPLRTAPGLDLWMGNHPGSSGFIETAGFPIYNHAELIRYEQMGEVAYTESKGRMAAEYIAAHPATFAGLTARRFLRFWLGTGSRDGSALFVAHAVFTTSFGLLGLWMLIRRRRWTMVSLFAVPLIVFPLPYYVTHAEFRFTLVLAPVLVLLAAMALVEIVGGTARTAAG
jgi:4-amino-4-deoxy-L-arabinose transferase-like glycosyltransferase